MPRQRRIRIRDALTKIQAQLQALDEKIKTDQRAIKDSKAEGAAKAAAQALAAKLKELKSQVQVLREKMTPFNEDLHANQTAIAQALSSFKTALESKDFTAAEAALQPVIPAPGEKTSPILAETLASGLR